MGSLYKIENIVNGKCYYGQTKLTPEKRKRRHFCLLKCNSHVNRHLQSSWNKYGEHAFTFTIISDKEADNQLDGLESQLIEIFQTMNPKYGYNKLSGGQSNKKMSSETIEKTRQANIGKRRSPATEFKKGQAPHNKNVKGIHYSPSTEFKKGSQPTNSISILAPNGTVYASITALAQAFKFSRSHLMTAIKQNKPYKGFYFTKLEAA